VLLEKSFTNKSFFKTSLASFSSAQKQSKHYTHQGLAMAGLVFADGVHFL